jgi:hypothetical protein
VPPASRNNGGRRTAVARAGIDDGLRAATHVALRMAVAGVPREQVAAHLHDTLQIDDPRPVLEYVFGAT